MSNYNISGADRAEGLITSGSHFSYWIDTVPPLAFSKLDQDISTDVVIAGGGISGLSIAYCLLKAGKQVVVVDDGFIGSGETGRTTAHIVNALDDRYSEIENVLGKEDAKLAAESHTRAIDFIEKIVREENIDCDFTRLNGYLFLHPSDKIKTLEDELDATHRVGIATELIPIAPGISSEAGPFLMFPDQAQFHPMKYMKGLTDAIIRMGGKIFTETRAVEFKKDGIKANDFHVNAEHIVVATNSPVNDLVTIHTKQHPYRTYVIGGLIPKQAITPGLWWDTGNMKSKWPTDPYHYVRIQNFSDEHDLLIAGGEDHKTGQADKENIPEEERYKNLEVWTRKHFPMMQEVIYFWSGQVMEPVDSLAFIGKNPGDQNIYIATGDSGNGMTHGTIAGMLISDLILGVENPWAKIYDPSRISLKATGTFLKEATNMAAQYTDYLKQGDIDSAAQLSPREGAIITMGMKKVAVYKDNDSKVHAYSAICPHLGCVLHWNHDEHSFDCPCHGSRFTCEGEVVNGPAISNLKKIDIQS